MPLRRQASSRLTSRSERTFSTINSSETKGSSISDTRVDLDGDEQIQLAMLYLRARESTTPNSVLNDVYARDVINKINADFKKTLFYKDTRYDKWIAVKAKQLDTWCQSFVDQHTRAGQPVTVVNLNCSLDSRNQRIERDRMVRWIDIDRAPIVDLRRRLMSRPTGDYRLVTADITEEDDWLRAIPTDRPTFILLENFTMYLTPEQGAMLLYKIIDHFPRGALTIDTVGSITVKFMSLVQKFREIRTPVTWAVDNARDLEALHSKLKLKEETFLYDLLDIKPFGKNAPPLFGPLTPFITLMPSYRKNGQYLLFEFS